MHAEQVNGWDMEMWERQIRHLPEAALCFYMESGYDFVRGWAIDEMRNRWKPDEIKVFIECPR